MIASPHRPLRLLPAASALALALAAAPAFAQVTAQTVWEDWKSGMMRCEVGVTIGSETYQGGVLTVTDLGFTATGDDGSVVSGTLPELVLSENGDGTVTVTMSETYPISISSPADPEEGSGATEVALALRHQGLGMTVSGEPGAMTYELAAARWAIELESVTEEGEPVPAEFVLALNDLSGTSISTGTEATDRVMEYDLAAASLDLLLDVTDPDMGTAAVISGQVAGLSSRGSLVLPLAAMAEPDAALVNGLAAEGGYGYGSARYLFEITDPETGPANGTVTTGAGELTFAVSGEAVAYDSQVDAVSFQVTSAALPFPVTASLEQYGVSLLMPLARSEAPADWGFGLNLTGLALNEEIWALFDPQAMLPRDPATVALDLTGTATLFFDLADPAQAEAMGDAVPGEVNSVSLNGLEIAFGGASVTGTGAFEIDNTDTTTFEGMPKPVGAAEFQLSGINGLIDTLAGMGLLPEDQVMGARMMLGLFATPTGEDQLSSRIEVTEDGQVLANGQRLQ